MSSGKLKICFILLFLSSSLVFAQTASSSWSFGFGISYPRYQSSDLRPLENNYGGYLSIQRNFSENVGLRLKGFYLNILGRVPGGVYTFDNGTLIPSETEEISNTIIGGGMDLLYNLAPCQSVSPYFTVGLGAVLYDPDWTGIVNPTAKSDYAGQVSAGFGVEWTISNDWKLRTEGNYHSVDGRVDGIVNNNRQGIFGSNADGYITFDLGLVVYFGKGEASKYCQLYEGIKAETEPVDLSALATRNDIEEIVQKYIPKEVVKEVVVGTPTDAAAARADQKWVLVGVNFDISSSNLREEAYPVLFHAVQVLLMNPQMKVEIQGHTDNIGSEQANQRLSLKRAQAVKDYLTSRGVSANRLSIKGFGETMPIADNKTASGRNANRRIEFKILN
ncbi:MAG: OmpA family protein [Melioribacteraceae bacterium]|nr:OmpA family protein [Melioribacteraceae bacterium]